MRSFKQIPLLSHALTCRSRITKPYVPPLGCSPPRVHFHPFCHVSVQREGWAAYEGSMCSFYVFSPGHDFRFNFCRLPVVTLFSRPRTPPVLKELLGPCVYAETLRYSHIPFLIVGFLQIVFVFPIPPQTPLSGAPWFYIPIPSVDLSGSFFKMNVVLNSFFAVLLRVSLRLSHLPSTFFSPSLFTPPFATWALKCL